MTEIKLSKPWEKFLIKLSTYKDFDILQWQEWHLVGYFMDKYYDHFKRKFSLSLQGPPGKCTEIVMMKKIAYSIGSIQKSVEYIDWIFEEKIKKKNVSVNTVGFLMTKGVINEYLKQKEKKEEPKTKKKKKYPVMPSSKAPDPGNYE